MANRRPRAQISTATDSPIVARVWKPLVLIGGDTMCDCNSFMTSLYDQVFPILANPPRRNFPELAALQNPDILGIACPNIA